ncbi:APO protein 1, chloroplastic, partial [Linum perenne]
AIGLRCCSECSEVHVAHSGHEIKTCLGTTNSRRHGMHSWVKGSINDILIPIESYHLYDPFGRRIKHETRWGVRKLMRKYTVKACGYCREVHVGPWGHNAKLCGEFKHQWRDGKHGWQDATVEEVFPPNYVWHVRDTKGPPLKSFLKRFYGKAPAVIEMCMHAGAEIPEKYKPMMRLDIIIPEDDEATLVA